MVQLGELTDLPGIHKRELAEGVEASEKREKPAGHEDGGGGAGVGAAEVVPLSVTVSTTEGVEYPGTGGHTHRGSINKPIVSAVSWCLTPPRSTAGWVCLTSG